MNKEVIESLKSLENVTVVAVSKTRTKEEIDAVAKMGLTVFGENKVQEFVDKYDSRYTWHIIGHLQTNKVKYIIGKVDVIESLDSIKLAKEIEKHAIKQNVIQQCLIQIKISDDEMKTGLPYQQALDFLEEMKNYPHIEIKGFMCVASNTDDESLIIEEFDKMNKLFDEAKKKDNNIDTLSMGMSDDYKLAIKHGSNMIRVGSAIFGKRDYSKKDITD